MFAFIDWFIESFVSTKSQSKIRRNLKLKHDI